MFDKILCECMVCDNGGDCGNHLNIDDERSIIMEYAKLNLYVPLENYYDYRTITKDCILKNPVPGDFEKISESEHFVLYKCL